MQTLKKKISAIKAGKNPLVQRSQVFLDGKFAFSLDNEVILKEKLKIGQVLGQREIDLLSGADRHQNCLNAAYSFLTPRPRSEAETRRRLAQKGYNASEIDPVLVQLKGLSLIDDQAFAEYWKENRTAFRPRSQRALKNELRQKGVEVEVVNAAIESVDETGGALQAARTKARTLSAADFIIFRQKLAGFLRRRGYAYNVIKPVIKQIWQEKTGEANPDVDSGEETGYSQH